MSRRAVEAQEDFEREIEVQALMIHLTDIVAEVMHRTETSRAELARRMGVSAPHITQTLTGERNMTVRTLAETLYAMGHRLQAHAVELEEDCEKLVEDHEDDSLSSRLDQLRGRLTTAYHSVATRRQGDWAERTTAPPLMVPHCGDDDHDAADDGSVLVGA